MYGLAWGAWLSDPPKVVCKVLSEYLYVYFKGEKTHSINQILNEVHYPKKVRTHITKACIFRKIIVKHIIMESLIRDKSLSLWSGPLCFGSHPLILSQGFYSYLSFLHPHFPSLLDDCPWHTPPLILFIYFKKSSVDSMSSQVTTPSPCFPLHRNFCKGLCILPHPPFSPQLIPVGLSSY